MTDQGPLVLSCLLVGPSTVRINALDRSYDLEMHPYCGPTVLGKKGQPLAQQPPAKSPFWKAVEWWDKQGRRVDSQGQAMYEPEPEATPILQHLGGKHYLVIGYENKLPEGWER